MAQFTKTKLNFSKEDVLVDEFKNNDPKKQPRFGTLKIKGDSANKICFWPPPLRIVAAGVVNKSDKPFIKLDLSQAGQSSKVNDLIKALNTLDEALEDFAKEKAPEKRIVRHPSVLVPSEVLSHKDVIDNNSYLRVNLLTDKNNPNLITNKFTNEETGEQFFLNKSQLSMLRNGILTFSMITPLVYYTVDGRNITPGISWKFQGPLKVIFRPSQEDMVFLDDERIGDTENYAIPNTKTVSTFNSLNQEGGEEEVSSAPPPSQPLPDDEADLAERTAGLLQEEHDQKKLTS